jgi:hypothetical protein
MGVGSSTLLYQRFANGVVHAQSAAAVTAHPHSSHVAQPAPVVPARNRQLPPVASQTILVGSYPVSDPASAEGVRALTDWLEAMGFPVFYADADLGRQGHWHRVLAGAYTDPEVARRDVVRLQGAAPASRVRLVSAEYATGTMEQ